ncbi:MULTISPECIES: malonyl-ACP O-methyltransferase BioC [unclassified Pseudomonas]|uniref:malonyl-ACP O-methyltransferase BioC n=1 Tax=unclassified Pseudomonas TaxID=196821 RepID=UPI000C8815DB|nr:MULTISPECIES: malonyl-ACP O-methyltransferase BioC [unclassified Pseudomonas]MBI6951156.1 malonyl-ACP O-methyltransferase BioC [Pseudomonas sp. CCOS 191]PNA02381.1 malonyl-[acyl-carrier protein] O-methyltransferase BioC [Pseudomonas sp. FW305-42]PNA26534.1 malonyl-[acyl-carrier protein] O-methyltransferase BioC [Pseudomonas sp. MPR-R1B]PNB29093.1 malonyl-[acyl-carrier protein] O-methyltransferase BioC [Pseudomonas sp. DP16D-E2]PNB43082.1 malonyl-[acyl-carrier protein] O-methyltransferase Bi
MTDLSQPTLPGALPDKRQVAASFSRAAASYDSVAALQRAVGMALLEKLPAGLVPARWLDMGSGTGHFSRVLAERFSDADGVAVDIAEGMLRHAREQGGARHHVTGDAERLPLRDGSVDLLFSSLAVQWCGQFASVLGEARRVLRPGGVLAFSSLCVGTLDELRASWQAVDGMVHVNRFRRFEDYQRLCGESGLELIGLERRPHVLHYPDVRSLTHELKALGAHNLNPGRPSGLTGRARMQGLLQAYEQFRQPQGLPATYQVVYGVLRKPLAGEQ